MIQEIHGSVPTLEVTLPEAKSMVGRVVKCDKIRHEFVAKLIDVIEVGNNAICVFQTKSGKIIKDPLSTIIMMQKVD
ncbi:MAG: hypothetical protein ABR985_02560 [Methanotrichaceae archaeon]|jgi:hypothetical protein